MGGPPSAPTSHDDEPRMVMLEAQNTARDAPTSWFQVFWAQWGEVDAIYQTLQAGPSDAQVGWGLPLVTP